MVLKDISFNNQGRMLFETPSVNNEEIVPTARLIFKDFVLAQLNAPGKTKETLRIINLATKLPPF